MATNLPPFPPFDIIQDQGALGLRWKKYIARFRNLLVAISVQDKKQQKALLLHNASAGPYLAGGGGGQRGTCPPPPPPQRFDKVTITILKVSSLPPQ